MPGKRLYHPNRAATAKERMRRYRIEHQVDANKSRNWARRRLNDLHPGTRIVFGHQWEDGKTVWIAEEDSAVVYLADPDRGTVHKMRTGH